jgi:putative endonuclease
MPEAAVGGDDRGRLGRWAEDLAAAYLESRGYRVLARNLRTPEGELDIVARKGEVLALVEVRARRGGAVGSAAESIGPRKRQRLLRAAAAYLQEADPTLQPRLDVLLVELSPRGRLLRLEHIEGAVEG